MSAKQIPSKVHEEFGLACDVAAIKDIDYRIGSESFGLYPTPSNTLSYLFEGTRGALAENLREELSLGKIPILGITAEFPKFEPSFFDGNIGSLSFFVESFLPPQKFIDTTSVNLTVKEKLGVAEESFAKTHPEFLSGWSSSRYIRGLYMLAFGELQLRKTGRTDFQQSKFFNLPDILSDLYQDRKKIFVIMGISFKNTGDMCFAGFSAFHLEDFTP